MKNQLDKKVIKKLETLFDTVDMERIAALIDRSVTAISTIEGIRFGVDGNKPEKLVTLDSDMDVMREFRDCFRPS